MKINLYILLILSFLFNYGEAQNETKKWHFGLNAGIDFMTVPPTVINNSSIYSTEGCASIADVSGNLLFYTQGDTIWNDLNVPMANGTGLFGNEDATQSSLIVKRPGSNSLYFVFTLDNMGNADGLRYSIIDISLAAGHGSVISKNNLLQAPSSEQLTGTLHCNGSDVWIISHDANSSNFRSFLLSSTGMNTTAIVSSISSSLTNVQYSQGQLKVSPNGKKIGFAQASSSSHFILYDFNNFSGVISNQLILGTFNLPYGCEFSPDGTKFYGSNRPYTLYQWDLCAGSGTAIISSITTITASTLGVSVGALQTGPDKKIYLALSATSGYSPQTLGIINNPNATGSLCNYVFQAQTLGSHECNFGLPNFISSFFRSTLPLYTYSVNCSSVTFSLPTLCVSAGYSVNSVSWSFGDTPSGAANSSTLSNPSHNYPAAGTYTTKAIVFYDCSSDTISGLVTIPGPIPILTISGNQTLCPGQSASITVTGANTYSWSGGQTTSNLVLTPSVTSQYTVTGTNTLTSCSSTKTLQITRSLCAGINEKENSALVRIYPNPGNGCYTIEAETNLEITIYDISGSQIYSSPMVAGKTEILLETIPDGIYFAKFKNNENFLIQKFIKLRN